MAWELVGRTSHELTSGVTATVSLTSLTGGIASSPIEGDVAAVFFATQLSATPTLDITTSGYTKTSQINQNNGGGRGIRAIAGVKVMGSSPDTAVGISRSGAATGAACLVTVEVWRGADATTPLDVGMVTASGTSGQPNPDPITPVTADALILVLGGSGDNSMPSAFASSDLFGFNQVTHDNTSSDLRMASGYKAWTSGAFDPAQWTGSTSSLYTWAAVTLALRPGITSITAPVGRSDESDAALDLAARHRRAAGFGAETDTALVLRGLRRLATGLASETDTALALLIGGYKARLASETDTALALGALQRRAAGIASEADLALARTVLRRIAIGLAAETDLALARPGGLVIPAITPPQRRLNLASSQQAQRHLVLSSSLQSTRRLTLPASRLVQRRLEL